MERRNYYSLACRSGSLGTAYAAPSAAAGSPYFISRQPYLIFRLSYLVGCASIWFWCAGHSLTYTVFRSNQGINLPLASDIMVGIVGKSNRNSATLDADLHRFIRQTYGGLTLIFTSLDSRFTQE